MIICELIVMEPIMGSMYNNFAHNGSNDEEAGFLFMEWLSCLTHPPMPQAVRHFDSELAQFLLGYMLVLDPAARPSLAKCLADPLVSGEGPESMFNIMPEISEDRMRQGAIAHQDHVDKRGRLEDHSSGVLHRGVLWKLNSHSHATDSNQWLQRDIWVTPNGSLCYFSQKEGIRLVLIDASRLHGATIADFSGGGRDHAFQILMASHDKNEPDDLHVFACNSSEEQAAWTKVLKRVVNLGSESPRSRLVVHELLRFKVAVHNHRKPIDQSARDGFQPFFRAKLWKLKSEGNPLSDPDWFYRDMWLSNNGSLVYWSEREDRELVYHTSLEVARASVVSLPLNHKAACKEFAFKLVLPPKNDLELSPSYFATDKREQREEWFEAFRHFTSFCEPTTNIHAHQRTPVRA